MATIKAFIRTSSKSKIAKVRLRLTDGRNFTRYGVTEIKLPVDLWDVKKEEIKGRAILPENIDRDSINDDIKKLKQKVLNGYRSIKDKDLIESDWIDKLLANKLDINRSNNNDNKVADYSFEELYDLYLGESKVTFGRKKQIKVVKSMFGRYLIIKKKDYRSISDISEFENFLRNEHLIQLKYPVLYSGIKEIKQRGQNTINARLKIVGAFYHWSIKKRYLINNPFLNYEYSPDVYGDPITLLPEEVELLYNSKIPENLELVRDMFCLQCYLGCRVNDFINLKKQNIEDDILIYIAGKTKSDSPKTIYVPLIDNAKFIINKYSNSDNDKLLPFINVNGHDGYNKKIKLLAKSIGLNRKVAVINSLNKKTEIKPLYDVMTTHTARKTFINTNYKETQDPALIAKMTGHAENSKAFSRYRKIDMDILREQMKKAFKTKK